MDVGKRHDPYLSYRFLVEIEGLVVGGFSEVSGLQAEVETEEYREGGVNEYVHHLPKVTKYQPLILKRGITDSTTLWQWHRDVVDAKIEPKSVYIVLVDHEKKELWRWVFEGAYPVKWVGPDLKATDSSIAIETLELVHNGIKKVQR